MRIGRQHRLRVVAEPGGDDMHRHAGRERQRRGGVPENVQAAARQPSGRPVLCEPFGEPLRMDRAAERVSEDEVSVHVRGAGERVARITRRASEHCASCHALVEARRRAA